MANKSTEDPDNKKGMESASDDDSSNLSSSDSVVDPENEESSRSTKKQNRREEEELDEDKMKSDDVDELSDSASHRQSKRKPSKSRIKRIVHKQSPSKTSSGTSTPGNPFPLPPIDSLVVMGPQAQASVMSQASMVPNLGSTYMQLSPGQQRTPGGYKCDVCGKVFRVPSRYESHMQNHSKGKPFCCDVCGKLFGSQIKLDIHKPVHGKDRKQAHDCPECGQRCPSWRSYLYHVSKHTGNGGKKHSCEVCGRQFFAAQRLRNHMQSHIDGKNFCCPKCGKLFESQKRLDTHSLIHNQERTDPFKCVDCGKVYDDWRAFKQHMKTHGSEGVTYTCEICASHFYTQYEKEKHMKMHSADQRHQCPNCTKSFWTASQLAVHMRNKHRSSKTHECVICGRECARASGLKQHMKMHAGDDDFFCHLCGSTFQNGQELASHSGTHNKERPFTCDQCGKSFVKRFHYHCHMVVHAAGQQFSCGVCSRQFDHSMQLTTHMATHVFDGQQKFACQACSLTFPSQVELEAHAHTHGRQPPYVCGLCGRLFAEQRYFRQHMKRHMARAQRGKLKSSSRHFSLPLSDTPTRNGAGTEGATGAGGVSQGGDHPCHMCGAHFGDSQSLVAHIEEHKQSGMQMYLNVIRKTQNDSATSPQQQLQKQHRKHDGSDDASCSASDSDVPEKMVPSQSKTTIHFGMRAHDYQTSTPKGSSGGSSILTQSSEQAMARPMPSFQATPMSSAAPTPTMSGVGRPSHDLTPHSTDGGMDRFGNQQADSFYSPPVFPGQSGSYATPYHAAAQQFQPRGPQDGFPNGGLEGGGAMDFSAHYAMPAKRLPDFSDFSRHLGLAGKPGFPDYPESGSGGGPGSSSSSGGMGHSSSMGGGGFSFPEGLSSASPGFAAGGIKPMPAGDEAPVSMPVFPSMSMYPHMPPPPPPQGPGSVAAGGGEGGGQPIPYGSMFQFQSLGN
ncbi:uncharacterized protein LOC143282395 [Babylonia areolata]|uniref:uncharacterized protein LOC143282395 n=1 Tax=Babylonia areolata TaxID=304850 RepID=UPI003FD5C9BA